MWSDKVREKIQLLQAALDFLKQIPEKPTNPTDQALLEDILALLALLLAQGKIFLLLLEALNLVQVFVL